MIATDSKKALVTILGEDRPGIVYAVSKAMNDLECNIEEVSQTILQTEFAGLFIVSMPVQISREALSTHLEKELSSMQLNIGVKDFTPPSQPTWASEQITEPFVITLRGRDRLGIIPGMTGVIAGFDVNIETLKAIAEQDDPTRVIVAFEVAVPESVHHRAFREALQFKAAELEMELSVQHRDIFEAIHRI
jgi:glycine cleavage system transcriptional repressor